MQWDVFCRVIDNFGDIGVCWRLAADLGGRGESVRLWTDDPSALSWMAPSGAPGVQVLPWPEAPCGMAPGDVVVEAFGCDPPAHVVEAMARMSPAPLWINLEYLSAEPYVERSHGLRSPQLSGPGAGLDKWFYYPGFTGRTGGLLREPDLLRQHDGLDTTAWLAKTLGIVRLPGERLVSLFCYGGAATLAALPSVLPPGPVRLLLTAGLPPPAGLPQAVTVHRLPHLSQVDYDHLLRACDLNFVRGEDSFVRAQWAARPFVWQIYPQTDGAHAIKLGAFLDIFLAAAPLPLATAVRASWANWNGLRAGPCVPHADGIWEDHCEKWRASLRASPDLVSGLLEFVSKTR
jgi:uncharacterized repeat protein (TIGR03837 family)